MTLGRIVTGLLLSGIPLAAGAQDGWPQTRDHQERPIVEWVAQLGSADVAERRAAAVVFARLGPRAAEAAPALASALADSDATVAANAQVALGLIGRSAVPPLVRALEHPAPGVRVRAVDALARNGVIAAPAASALEERLSDPDPLVRRASADALTRIGEVPPSVPLSLGRLLSDADEDVRVAAVKAIERLGASAVPVVAELVTALGDPPVRVGAARALEKLGPAAAPAVAPLRKLLAGKDRDVKMVAAGALGAIGVAAKPALAELRAMSGDGDFYVAVAGQEAVKKIDAALAAAPKGGATSGAASKGKKPAKGKSGS